MTGCTLCDLDLPADPVTDPDVDGAFCCQGCLNVARTLGDDEAPAFDPPSTDALAEADGETAYLSVDGMHCATCERFLESTATDHEGIEAATANYATDSMKVVYDPDTVAESDLSAVVSGHGYRARSRDSEPTDADDAPISRLLVGAILGMMTMALYVLFVYPQHFGFDPIVTFGRFGRLYLLGQIWLFTTVVLGYTGFPLLRGAYVSLRAGQPNMDLLVTVAATSAYLYSTAVALTGGIDVYFDVTVAIVLVVTAGNYYENRIKRSAVSLLSELTTERVAEARTRDGETVPVDAVAPGTELLVRPGERIPLDGRIVDGTAAVDEALVTGESLPVTKRPGDAVLGGSIVTDQPLVVEVGESGTSTLDRIVDLLWDAQSSRGAVQQLANKLARLFVPAVVVVAVLAAGGTLALGGTVTETVLVALTVLIVSCPCALGLATPLAAAAGVQRAAADGVVIGTETVFESLPTTDVVAVDKTGTLTTGEMVVTAATGEQGVLDRAAALEQYSNHPIAEAIVAHATGETPADRRPEAPSRRDDNPGVPDGGITAPNDAAAGDMDASSVTVRSTGVVGSVDGTVTMVGHPDLFDERDWVVPDTYRERASEAARAGDVPVFVGWNGRCRGILRVSDQPRDEWEAVVRSIAADGRDIVVLTGDENAAARRFDEHPDVDDVFAGLPPDGKVAAVRELSERGSVTMIGDGANDAPALAAADVGVAIASGTHLATEAADAVVTNDRLEAVSTLFAVTAVTRRRIRQNLLWAFGYNLVAIPLAVTGLLNPLFAAVAMGTSSALVVTNSARRMVPST